MLREKMASLEEFLEYYDTASCCIDNDKVFCNMVTGVWLGTVNVRSKQSSHRSEGRSVRTERTGQSGKSGQSKGDVSQRSRPSGQSKGDVSQRSRPSGQEHKQYSRGGDNTS